MRDIDENQIETMRQRLQRVDLRAIAVQAAEDARADAEPPQALAMLPALLGREIDDPAAFAHFLERLMEQADLDRNLLVKWGTKAAVLSGPTVIGIIAGSLIVDYILYNEFGDGSGYGVGKGFGAAYDQYKAAMR